MAREERKIAADRTYRTPARVLRRLSAGSIVYEAPGAKRGDWDRFAIRNVGIAVQRRMSEEFAGDAEKIRTASAKRIAGILGSGLTAKSDLQKFAAFENLAVVLALIPDLPEWTASEKKDLALIIRAKTEQDESRYARLLQRHIKLRSALIKLGEPAP
jgi:hypothetical protein